MSKDNKTRMPMSGSGLVNYSEDSESKLRFKPSQIVILVAAVMLVLFLLHNFGYSLLGIPQ